MSSSCPPSPSLTVAAEISAGQPGWAGADRGGGWDQHRGLCGGAAADRYRPRFRHGRHRDAAFAISVYGLPLFGLFAGHLPRRLIAAGIVIAGSGATTAQSSGARMLSGLAYGVVLPNI